MIKRLADNNISYDDLLKKYDEGKEKCRVFLRGEVNNKAEIIKSNNVLEKIINFLQQKTVDSDSAISH